jgi:hypothetical protein
MVNGIAGRGGFYWKIRFAACLNDVAIVVEGVYYGRFRLPSPSPFDEGSIAKLQGHCEKIHVCNRIVANPIGAIT